MCPIFDEKKSHPRLSVTMSLKMWMELCRVHQISIAFEESHTSSHMPISQVLCDWARLHPMIRHVSPRTKEVVTQTYCPCLLANSFTGPFTRHSGTLWWVYQLNGRYPNGETPSCGRLLHGIQLPRSSDLHASFSFGVLSWLGRSDNRLRS